MTRTWWVKRLFSAPIRRPRPGARPSLLWLEDRTAPAALTEADAGKTLVVTLNEANEALTVASAGATYSFTTSGTKFTDGGVTAKSDFAGIDTKNLSLLASGLARYDTVRVLDTAAGAKVTFADSGANQYSDQFQVILDNTSAGVEFQFGAAFGANLATFATDSQITVGSGATVSGSGGILLQGNAVAIDTSGTPGTVDGAGGRVEITPFNTASQVNLGGADAAGVVGLTNAEVQRVTAATIQVGNTGTTGGITLSDNVTVSGSATLALRNAGAITQTAGKILTVPNLAATGSSVALDTAAHAVGTLAGVATAGDFAFKGGSATGLTVGAVDGVAGVAATGQVTIRSVNDLTVASETIDAGTTIALVVADGNAAGKTAKVFGAFLDAPGGATITGGAGSDTFELRASPATKIDVDGGLPSAPATPGDTLVIDGELQVVTVKFQGGGTSKGDVTVGAAKPITFQEIESVQVNNALTSETVVNGTAGNDVLVLSKSGGSVVYALNGAAPVLVVGTKFTFNGLDGDDRMLVDFGGGDPALADGVIFNGGNNTDTLQVKAAGLAAGYRPSGADSGGVQVGTQSIAFATAERLDATGAATVSVTFPGADDALTVANGKDFGSNAINALVVSSPAAAFAPVALWSNGTVAIDTADAGGADGNDTVTITSANNAHANSSLSVRTGAGTDTITINGAVDVGGSFSVDSVAINVNADITAGATVTLTHTGALQLGAVTVSGAAGVAEGGGGAVTLTGDATAKSTGGGVTFAGAIDALAAGGQSLTINGAAGVVLAGSVGQTTRLKSLDVTADVGSIELKGASYKTQLDQTYLGSVVVEAAAVLFDAAGAVTFAIGGLDGAAAVTVTAGGGVGFLSPVGGEAALASLTVTAAAIEVDGGLIRTTGDQTYNAPVSVGPGASFVSTGGGNVLFGATLDAPAPGVGGATVATAGTTTFTGAVGGVAPLAFLITNAGGTTQVNGGLVRTTGDQFFSDAVTVGANTLFATTAGGDVTFASTLTGPGLDVTVNATGRTTFGGAVTVGTLTTDAGGTTEVVTKSLTSSVGLTFGDAVLLLPPGGGVITVTVVGGGDVTFASSVDGPGGLAVVTGGTTTFAGPVGAGTPLASLTSGAGGVTVIGGGLVRTVAGQGYGDDVVLTAGTGFIDGGIVLFHQTLSGAVGVVTASPQVVFSKAVHVGHLTVNAAAGPFAGVTVAGPTVSATTGQSYALPVTVTGSTAFASAAGDVTFGQTLGGGFDVSVVSPGTTTFGGPVGLASLATDAAGMTVVRGGSVTTSGLQWFNDAVAVADQNAAFTSTGGGVVVFGSALAGGVAVAVNTAGVSRFDGPVSVAALSTDAAGVTNVNAGLVETLGDQAFGDPVGVGAAVTFRAGGNALFGSSLGGSVSVAVQSPATTYFGGPVNLGALATDAPGQTGIDGGSVATAGGQFYGDAVGVGADTTFASAGGALVAFGQTLAGPGRFVAVNTAGQTTFAGAVRVGVLATDAGGTTAVNGGSVVTDGSQFFGDAVTVGADATFAAGDQVRFGPALGGPSAVVVLAPGATTFGGPVSLGSLATDAPGVTVVNTDLVQTQGGQDFGDAVTANVSATFAGAALTYRSNLSSGNSVTLQSGGDATFFAPVAVGSLFTDAGGRTVVRGGAVDATAGQSYGDDVMLGVTARLATAGGDLSFLGRLDAEAAGGQGLTAAAPAGTMLFAGAVGSAGPVAFLAADAVTTRLAADFRATGDVAVTARGGGVDQQAGFLTTATLGLAGSGTFTLDQLGTGDAGNDVTGTFRANVAGPIRLADHNDLTVDAAGVVSGNNPVTIRTGRGFTAEDLRADGKYGTPLINVGDAQFVVDPGHFGPAVVTFDAEIDPAQAVFGLPGGENNFPDEFRIRPSAAVPIQVNGNAPGNPLLPGQQPDVLVPLLSGARIAGFSFDGSSGVYTFNDRAPLSFAGFESLARRALAGFVVQTGEPRDATGAVQIQYAVRIVQTQAQQQVVDGKVVVAEGVVPLPGGLDGKALLQNPFVVAPSFVNPASPNAAPRLAFGDVNGDGAVDLILADGPGSSPLITVVDGRALNVQADGTLRKLEDLIQQGQVLAQFYAYDPRFLGGVNVTTADLDGDGSAEVITGAEQGGGPHVRVFNLKKGGDIGFFVYEPTFTGGVRVATGDVNGDGTPDLVLGAGLNGGPRVTVVDGKTLAATGNRTEIANFFAYDAAFRGGIYVDAGDYDRDGFADVLTGPGVGGGSHVRVFSGKAALAGPNPTELAGFMAFTNVVPDNPLFTPSTPASGVGGVGFSGSSPTGSRNILVGTGRGPQVQVREFLGNGGTPVESVNLLENNQFIAQGVNPETQVQNPIIFPLPTLLGYGASVGGFADPFTG